LPWDTAKYTAKFQKLQFQSKSVHDLKLVLITIYAYPTGINGGPPDTGMVYLWQQEVSEQTKAKNLLAENVKKAYTLVLGQCSPK
jgi:hypothetical protein